MQLTCNGSAMGLHWSAENKKKEGMEGGEFLLCTANFTCAAQRGMVSLASNAGFVDWSGS